MINTLIKKVRKRDGEIVPFEKDRITKAVNSAVAAVEGKENWKLASKIADMVLEEMEIKFGRKIVPGVEDIQDIVEEALIKKGLTKVAKAYILYRSKRAQVREASKTIPEKVRELADASKKYFRNDLAEFIYYRTYSRWVDEESRRETWIETVSRYMNFMRENLGDQLDLKEYEEIQNAILNQEVVPSMRLMWGAGKAVKKTNVCAYNCSYIAPSKLGDFAEIMYLSMCGTGVGFSVESQTVQKLPIIKHQTGKAAKIYVIEDSKEGWGDALTLGLKAWYGGGDVKFDYSKIRPAGARLHTMGGQSSGPDPLRALLDFARAKIFSRQGKRLTNIDVHDIICKIGEVVVMGGVRRSALISLSDLDDKEMRHAKEGQFYLFEPQRQMANNSAAYNRKPTTAEFMEEWLALAKSGTGERGIFNRAGLKHQLPERRWKVFKKYFQTSGTNPCIPSDTWVMTSKGAKRVRDLIDKPFLAVVNGNAYQALGFFKTGRKQVFKIKTARGFTFKATQNHRVLVVDYRSRKIQRNVWKEVKDLTTGDEIVLHNHKDASWEGRGTKSEGWLIGSLLGDGNIEKGGKANLDYWGKFQNIMMTQAVDFVHETVGGRRDLAGHIARTGYARVQSVGLGKLARSYGLTYGSKVATNEIEKTSSDFYEGFLRGWFDADGSVQGSQKKGVSIRLASSVLPNLRISQRMLARLGIISTIYKNRRPAGLRLLPNGKGGLKKYFCLSDHELVISGDNLKRFQTGIGFSDPEKKEKLEMLIGKYRRKLNREKFSSRVAAVVPCGKKNVYDCQVPSINAFDGNGAYLHNCGEIVLRSKQFCNLSEVICRAEDTSETLLRKIRLATILGTYQSTLTHFPYLSKEWKQNCEEERLLGVSLTGQWDCPQIRNAEVLKGLREKAILVNKKYAKRFGINASTCISCVKPSGTVSQLVDAASGMHPRHAKYYIRRVRISATDPLFHMLRDQKFPHYPEVGQPADKAVTYVIEFPVKAPKSAITRDNVSALGQLEHWKMVKDNYTEHNPSVTVSVGEDEWIDTANWLYKNWEMLGGLSFLPRTEHSYALAPYEEINEERYNELVAKLPRVDFSQILLYEKGDSTQGAKELACVAGVCEIEEVSAVNTA